ncbi:MAG: hypothetical protein KDB79_12565, partial [Acidobacteria bacterium]|nr:hypothetical protein [Acidobacteriota bacterium]
WIKDYVFGNWPIMKDRLIITRRPNADVRKVEFWIYPQTQVKKLSNMAFSFSFSGTALFDRAFADVPDNRIELDTGPDKIFSDGYYRYACDFGPNTSAFADVLLSNETTNGHIIIFNKSRKNKKKIKDFALNKLVNKYKVPRNRLKVLDGGERNDPEIEFWLVPQNSKIQKDMKELK